MKPIVIIFSLAVAFSAFSRVGLSYGAPPTSSNAATDSAQSPVKIPPDLIQPYVDKRTQNPPFCLHVEIHPLGGIWHLVYSKDQVIAYATHGLCGSNQPNSRQRIIVDFIFLAWRLGEHPIYGPTACRNTDHCEHIETQVKPGMTDSVKCAVASARLVNRTQLQTTNNIDCAYVP